jgi:methionyl-tRNA formyltransferase
VRALFFGTPAIAVPSLLALCDLAEVVGVVCQPDKPVGRSQALVPPPVKVAALERGLLVHQPSKVRVPEFAQWVREREADVAVVLAYGRILVKDVLTAPRVGCLNLHASLLPRWRGAAPITWAVVAGDDETGISLMAMDEGLDTGPVLSTHRIPIGPYETAGELSERIAALGAEVLRADLARAVGGELTAVPQDDSRATLARILTKDDGRIDWSKPAQAVHDHVRGMSPWPGAFTTAGGKGFKVLATKVGGGGSGGTPGTVLRADKMGISVACGAGAIEILRGQVEGRKPLGAPELVAGRAIGTGEQLGG